MNQNETIGTAFDTAKNLILSGQTQSINDIQASLIQDNLGIKDAWNFNSNLSL